MVLRLPVSWRRKDPIFFVKLLPLFFLAHSGIVYRGGPLIGVARKILAVGTSLATRRWRAPWGVLPVGPGAATIGVGDVNGGPPGGAAGRSGSGHHQSW
jgi:hypothetical protein